MRELPKTLGERSQLVLLDIEYFEGTECTYRLREHSQLLPRQI